uniref:Uncharacterized protein n=1 Tax=Octopus bimaculoides TaxID=37653 RepID=A0A0L8IBC7_OCTBM
MESLLRKKPALGQQNTFWINILLPAGWSRICQNRDVAWKKLKQIESVFEAFKYKLQNLLATIVNFGISNTEWVPPLFKIIHECYVTQEEEDK